jgi:hypothetical protein
MKTIEIKVYWFGELPEEAKRKAVENMYDINVNYDWWDCIYEDADQICCKINGFDIGRGQYCELETKYGFKDTATEILKNHGEMCETYKIAVEFFEEYDSLVKKYSDGGDTVTEENEYDFDQEADELESEYEKKLGEEYLSMLERDYEYRTSEEAIIETIEANEYEFTEDGKLF